MKRIETALRESKDKYMKLHDGYGDEPKRIGEYRIEKACVDILLDIDKIVNPVPAKRKAQQESEYLQLKSQIEQKRKLEIETTVSNIVAKSRTMQSNTHCTWRNILPLVFEERNIKTQSEQDTFVDLVIVELEDRQLGGDLVGMMSPQDIQQLVQFDLQKSVHTNSELESEAEEAVEEETKFTGEKAKLEIEANAELKNDIKKREPILQTTSTLSLTPDTVEKIHHVLVRKKMKVIYTNK